MQDDSTRQAQMLQRLMFWDRSRQGRARPCLGLNAGESWRDGRSGLYWATRRDLRRWIAETAEMAPAGDPNAVLFFENDERTVLYRVRPETVLQMLRLALIAAEYWYGLRTDMILPPARIGRYGGLEVGSFTAMNARLSE